MVINRYNKTSVTSLSMQQGLVSNHKVDSDTQAVMQTEQKKSELLMPH